MKRQRGKSLNESPSSDQAKTSDSCVNDCHPTIVAASQQEDYEEVIKLAVQAMLKKQGGIAQWHSSLLSGQGITSLYDSVISSLGSLSLASHAASHHLQEARAQHSLGHMDEANQALSLTKIITEKNIISAKDIDSIVHQLKTQWQLSYIYRLSVELLLDIFAYLDTPDLISCHSTNKQWREAIASSHILTESVLLLEGTVDQVQQQWKKSGKFKQLRRLSVHFRGGKFNPQDYCGGGSDDADFMREEDLEHCALQYEKKVHAKWFKSLFYKEFPYDWLYEVDYASENAALDYAFWHQLQICNNLAVLRWHVAYHNEDYEELFDQQMNLHHTLPLSRCRLHELDIGVNENTSFGIGFSAFVSEAQVMRFKKKSSFNEDKDSDIGQTLLAAKDTLVELYLDQVKAKKVRGVSGNSQVFSKLEKCEWHCSDLQMPGIQAPVLKELIIKRQKWKDGWSDNLKHLLRSSMHSLEVLHYDAAINGALPFLVEELLFHMPQCRDLTISFRRIWQADTNSFKPFWNALQTKSKSSEAHLFLPKLESLTLDVKTKEDLRDDDIISLIQTREKRI